MCGIDVIFMFCVQCYSKEIENPKAVFIFDGYSVCEKCFKQLVFEKKLERSYIKKQRQFKNF